MCSWVHVVHGSVLTFRLPSGLEISSTRASMTSTSSWEECLCWSGRLRLRWTSKSFPEITKLRTLCLGCDAKCWSVPGGVFLRHTRVCLRLCQFGSLVTCCMQQKVCYWQSRGALLFWCQKWLHLTWSTSLNLSKITPSPLFMLCSSVSFYIVQPSHYMLFSWWN